MTNISNLVFHECDPADFPYTPVLGTLCSPDNDRLYIYTESGWMDIVEYASIPPMPNDLAESLANF